MRKPKNGIVHQKRSNIDSTCTIARTNFVLSRQNASLLRPCSGLVCCTVRCLNLIVIVYVAPITHIFCSFGVKHNPLSEQIHLGLNKDNSSTVLRITPEQFTVRLLTLWFVSKSWQIQGHDSLALAQNTVMTAKYHVFVWEARLRLTMQFSDVCRDWISVVTANSRFRQAPRRRLRDVYS